MLRCALPAGWDASVGGATIFKAGVGAPDTADMVVDLWEIAKVYQDPCRSNAIPAVSVGPTVDDLVGAFAAQKRGSPVTPVATSVDGFPGKQIDLVVPLGIDLTQCEAGKYLSWQAPDGGQRWNQGPGQHDLLQILDVNSRRYVIQRSFYAATTAADRAEAQAIVDSMRIPP